MSSMSRLTMTVFHDPKAKDTPALVERLASVGPSLHIGIAYVDITQDKDLMKRYATVAPVGTMAGTIIFSGGLDEQALRGWVKRLQKK
jgi:hypothetical protein